MAVTWIQRRIDKEHGYPLTAYYRGIKESFMTCSNDSHLRIRRSIDEENGYPLNAYYRGIKESFMTCSNGSHLNPKKNWWRAWISIEC